MKKEIIFTILILSLAVTGCTSKISPIIEDIDEQIINEKKYENTSLRKDSKEHTKTQKQDLIDNDVILTESNVIESVEGWRVYEDKNTNVRLKYHKDWYYQKYNDERSEGYDLFVGFALDSKILDYAEPYPIEFVIVSKDNVGDSDSGLLITEKNGKLYKLYTIDKKKYGDILNKMADSFSLFIEATENESELIKNKKIDLGNGFFKDENFVYYGEITTRESSLKKLDNIDPNSFELINKFYSKDKNRVYRLNEYEPWITGVSILEDSDPATFKLLQEDGFIYGKDKNNVYYEWKKIQGADTETFQILDYPYSKDKNNVYYSYEGIVESADPETFIVVKSGFYMKDKNNVYYNGKIIQGADSETFEFVKPGYAKDKNNVYHGKNIVEGVDPKTFIH